MCYSNLRGRPPARPPARQPAHNYCTLGTIQYILHRIFQCKTLYKQYRRATAFVKEKCNVNAGLCGPVYSHFGSPRDGTERDWTGREGGGGALASAMRARGKTCSRRRRPLNREVSTYSTVLYVRIYLPRTFGAVVYSIHMERIGAENMRIDSVLPLRAARKLREMSENSSGLLPTTTNSTSYTTRQNRERAPPTRSPSPYRFVHSSGRRAREIAASRLVASSRVLPRRSN